MLRKTTAAVVLAGALALGTASATSLGTFDDVSFAAGSVDLIDCTLPDNGLELLPELPSVDDAVSTLTSETFLLDSLDLSALPANCLDQVADIVIIGLDDVDPTSEEVLEVQEDVDLSQAAGTPLPVDGTFDITRITEVRVVVHSPDPTP